MALRELLADFRVKVSGVRELGRANQGLDQAAAAARKADGAFKDAAGRWRAANRRFLTMGERAKLLGTQLDGATDSFSGLTRQLGLAAKAYAAYRAVLGATRLSDEYTTLQNRIKFVTKSQAERVAVEERLFRIANRNFQQVGDTAELFQRYSIATADLGLNQEQVLEFTDRLQRATVLTAGSAAEAQGALVQLAQGIGTNFEAAGQELRSIQEQAPVLAGIIAKAAGGNASQLLKLAKEGKINAKLVVDAVTNAGAELDRAFIERSPKFSDSVTLMGNALLKFTGRIQDATGASDSFNGFAGGMLKLLERLEQPLTKLVGSVDLFRIAMVALGVTLAATAPLWAPIVASMAAAAASAIAAAAPFILLGLAIEDFIGFLKGEDSLIGQFFEKLLGSGGAQRVRDYIDGLWETVKAFFEFLTGDRTWAGFLEVAGDTFAMLGDLWANVWERISDIASEFWDALPGLLDAGMVAFGEWLDGVERDFKEVFERMALAAADFIRTLPGGKFLLGEGTGGGALSEIGNAAANLFGFGDDNAAAPAAAVAGSSPVSNSSVTTGDKNITINMSSADPGAVAGAVSSVLEASDRRAVMSRAP